MIDLFLLPAGIPQNLERNRPVVVFDIFRASTTITAALASGAQEVLIATSPDEAMALRDEHGAGSLLAGERDGFRIDGYDLGNSPYEMTPQKVGGRTIIFDSTNGSKLLRQFDDFPSVVIGSLAALSATVTYIGMHSVDPIIACAGRIGLISLEDSIAAGLLLSRLGRPEEEMDDACRLALRAVRQAGDGWAGWAAHSFHGRYLTSIGMGRDVDYCLTLDRFDFAPIKDGDRIVKPIE